MIELSRKDEIMKKIMFICTGNICRSAMADAYMKKRVLEEKLPIEICSSGVYAENHAQASYLAIEAMKEYDVDLTGHKATNTQNSNISQMDIILCATTGHKQLLLQMMPNLRERIYTIKEYAYGKECDNLDISDPWGYDATVYRSCANQIVQAIEKIIEKEKISLTNDENNI